MSRKATRRALSIMGAAVLTLVVALTPHAALANTPESDAPETVIETMPMTVAGYDAEVAEANGFKIVTHEDGTQESVPVTDAAVTQRQQADQLRAVAQQDDTSPSVAVCGDSWASGTKVANDSVAFSTGFLVYGAAYAHTWTVYATGAITANSWTTSGAGPASGTKSWTGAIPGVVGPGVGGVPFGSASASVILVDGTVCYSVGPTFLFG